MSCFSKMKDYVGGVLCASQHFFFCVPMLVHEKKLSAMYTLSITDYWVQHIDRDLKKISQSCTVCK